MSPASGRSKGKGKKKHPEKKRHHVKVNPKDVTLNKCDAPDTYLNKPDDQALWHSGDGGAYAIAFYAGPPSSPYVSPFPSSVFTVKPGSSTSSGRIKGDAPKGPYKYRVAGDNGCHKDPVFHIGP